MQLLHLSALLALAACCYAQEGLPENLAGLAEQFPGMDKLNGSNVPSVDDATKLLKEKCEKLANTAAYDKIVTDKDTMIKCFTDNLNVTQIQEEIEKAKPTGDLDTVFVKYCVKTPVLMECVKKFTASLDPCLEEGEKKSKDLILNITESLANFVCYKDGDRIAMFIAEGGFECLGQKEEGIQRCANKTISKRLPSSMPTIDNLPLFIIDKDKCDDLQLLQTCVVEELETCTQPTPANIVESLFKFIRRVTPCEKLQKGRNLDDDVSPSSASAVLMSGTLLAGALVLKYL